MGIKTELESEYDYDIVDEFIDFLFAFEASSELIIMNLNKEELYSDSINEIYRMFHNLKSACGYLHLELFIKLLVLGEDILDVARECKGPATEEFVSWVLLLRDQIVLWQHEILEDREKLSPPSRKVIKIPINVEKK